MSPEMEGCVELARRLIDLEHRVWWAGRIGESVDAHQGLIAEYAAMFGPGSRYARVPTLYRPPERRRPRAQAAFERSFRRPEILLVLKFRRVTLRHGTVIPTQPWMFYVLTAAFQGRLEHDATSYRRCIAIHGGDTFTPTGVYHICAGCFDGRDEHGQRCTSCEHNRWWDGSFDNEGVELTPPVEMADLVRPSHPAHEAARRRWAVEVERASATRIDASDGGLD